MVITGTTIAIGSLATTSVVSFVANICQAVQNRRLRKQIEMLYAIIENLKEEQKALKIWFFTKRGWEIQKEKCERQQELNELKMQAA